MLGWEVEGTDQFASWYLSLDDRSAVAVDRVIERLGSVGPGLGRPIVDTIATDLMPNLKELRVGSIRILFGFDPRRVAILLIGGDKRDEWSGWYARMVPVAVQLYREHLAELEQETDVDASSRRTHP